jgi:hypothetical protein
MSTGLLCPGHGQVARLALFGTIIGHLRFTAAFMELCRPDQQGWAVPDLFAETRDL